jgi:hypothetical protein
MFHPGRVAVHADEADGFHPLTGPTIHNNAALCIIGWNVIYFTGLVILVISVLLWFS